MPNEFDKLDAVAASGLVTAALISTLVSGLVRKGALTTAERREIYEHALLILEALPRSSRIRWPFSRPRAS